MSKRLTFGFLLSISIILFNCSQLPLDSTDYDPSDNNEVVDKEQSEADIIPPYIISVFPSANAINVETNTVLKIDFSEEMNKGSVSNAFSLKVNSNLVSGTVSWTNNSFYFAPLIPFAYDATCVFSIGTNSMDLNSNHMIEGVTYQFIIKAPPVAPITSSIYISEYVEGSANNKVIEIFNGTPANTNLNNFYIKLYMNGSTNSTTSIRLSNFSLPSMATFVIAHSSADPEVLIVANQRSSLLNFNGNDIIELGIDDGGGFKTVDIIGQVGNNTLWGAYVTLRRKTDILKGDTNGTDLFDRSLEWNIHSKDDTSGLGVR